MNKNPHPTPEADLQKAKAEAAYNSAADSYDDPANSFWERFGRRTIERLQLLPGNQVLDVCCGSGASALPAAEAVGPNGSVIGVDIADNLLELARKKAQQRQLSSTHFQKGDLLNLEFRDEHFDAVICVFGIFFVPDMATAIRELWRVVKPGGKLAITTWGPRFFEPVNTAFWNSIREVRPDLYKGFNPWDRITEPESLRSLLLESGIEEASIVAESNTHDIPSPEAWWTAVLGSGYRGTVDQLSEKDLPSVRDANEAYIRRSGVHSVEANVIYAIAVKD